MASRGIRKLLPTIVLAAALAAHNTAVTRSVADWSRVLEDILDDDDDFEDEDEQPPKEKRRRCVIPRADYRGSAWAKMLKNPYLRDHTTRAARLFRSNFRIPYPFFTALVNLVKRRSWFPTAQTDAVGRQCIPVAHKVLACLQILGRGNCFADISQMSLMSPQTAAATFHKFCENFAKELYDEHIFLPTGEYLDKVMAAYDKLGFTGAVGSTDVTHVLWGMCAYNQARDFTGKEKKPSIAYQVTVDHSGRALSVTEGFSGSTNDKTIIRYDLAVTMIRENPTYTERVFKVYNADGTTRQLKGCYLLVDNGYHEWVTLMPPSKYPGTAGDLAFSKMLESVRKDVECFFGILKGRFRILKLSIPYHNEKDINNVFFTCCILHNMLHTFDGMDDMYVDADWAGPAGLHNAWEHDPLVDFSSVGAKDSQETIEVEVGHKLRKNQLITSFMFRKQNKDITWLKR